MSSGETPLYTGNLGGLDMREVSGVTNKTLSWSMDEASQLTFTVHDEGAQQLRANYFQLRRDVVVGNDVFQISSLRVEPSEGKSPLVTCECRRINTQVMKRDKQPDLGFQAASATEYARIQAERVGLQFQGEQTAVVPNIAPVGESAADESVWDVIQSLASEAKFVVFESDYTLYFASERWLIGKYGIQAFGTAGLGFLWPSVKDFYGPTAEEWFPIVQYPECYKSDDDPYAGEFTVLIERQNAVQIRPGMTVTLRGVPDFESTYLVSEVSYDLDVPDPVTVKGRTPARPADQEEFRGGFS